MASEPDPILISMTHGLAWPERREIRESAAVGEEHRRPWYTPMEMRLVIDEGK